MSDHALQTLGSSEVPQRLLRFLIASPGGVDVSLLGPKERSAAEELVRTGCAIRDESLLRANRESAVVTELAHAAVEGALDDADLVELLVYLQTLTTAIGDCASVSDLFRAAFRNLAGQLPFDLAVAVTVEQNLLLYVTHRENGVSLVDETLIAEVRAVLEQHLDLSFSSTDVVQHGDFPDLPPREIIDSDEPEKSMLSELRIENRIAGVLVIKRQGAPFSWGEQRLLDFFANQISLLLGTVRAQEQVQNLADTDDMTGIWNRRYFRRHLEAEIERARIYHLPLSLMTFDVDSFKEINDTFGHGMGDVVLSELCGVVRESLRQPDLFARVGGDEFSILLPHTDLRGAQHLAERILRKVRRMTIPGESNTSVTCSVSIGMATYVPGEMNADDLVRRADERLYVSKKSGKNRYS